MRKLTKVYHWKCPDCGATSTQPQSALAVGHFCKANRGKATNFKRVS